SHVPTTDDLRQLNSVLCYDGYLTPHNPANQEHCIGASYDRLQLDTQFDPVAQKENGERLVKCVPKQAWPQQVDTTGNSSRQGIRCVSRDHLPFVGNIGDLQEINAQYQDLQGKEDAEVTPIHYYPNLFCLLGLGSRGLSSA